MAKDEKRDWRREAFHLGASLLTYLLTPWGLLVSAALAMWATTWGVVFNFAREPHVQLAVQAFLAVFWTFIGIRVLVLLSTEKTSDVKIVPDYRYAINPDGYQVAFDETKPDAAFGVSLNFRNMLNNPIKVHKESIHLIFDDRVATPNKATLDLVLPRVSARGWALGTFKRDAIKDRNEGMLDLVMVYGDADGDYTRRYRFKVKLYLNFQKDEEGKYVGAQMADDIIEITDEPI